MLSGNEDQKLIDYKKKFISAAADGDLETLKNLLEDKSKNIDPNFRYSNKIDSFTALYIAAQNNHIECRKTLIRN
jgi:hypothetical protein